MRGLCRTDATEPNKITCTRGSIQLKSIITHSPIFDKAFLPPCRGKIQFLMPIYLEGVQAIQEGESKEVLPPTVALSMELVHGQYIGTTILTLDMAYQNARLIARGQNTQCIRDAVGSAEAVLEHHSDVTAALGDEEEKDRWLSQNQRWEGAPR